jgi:HAD superfamily hydrolase (TIGR01549 family)
MIICFDLDGTLIDTEKWVLNGMLKSMRNHKLKVTKKDILNLWGLPFRVVLKKLFPNLKKQEIEEIKKDFEKIRSETENMIKPFKNTKKTLKKLSKNYSLCLLSNNPHRIIIKVLDKTKIDKKLFKVIIGNDEVKRPKPFPDEIYKAEKKLNKKVTFMVGDTIQDIKTAKAAKIRSIIILTGPKSTWKTLNKANYKIKDIKELPSLIKEVNK